MIASIGAASVRLRACYRGEVSRPPWMNRLALFAVPCVFGSGCDLRAEA